MKRITDWVREGLESHLRPGDWALDATLGQGHDTKILLEAVTATGRVFGFDVQAQAVDAVRQLFSMHGQFEAFLQNHAEMSHYLPATAKARLRAAVFNLGYLPGSDHRVTTQTASTLAALACSLEWLAPDGVLSCTCYPGTTQGALETSAVLQWAEGLPSSSVRQTRIESVGTRERGPLVLWLEKR